MGSSGAAVLVMMLTQQQMQHQGDDMPAWMVLLPLVGMGIGALIGWLDTRPGGWMDQGIERRRKTHQW